MTIGRKLSYTFAALMTVGLLSAAGSYWNIRRLCLALEEAIHSESKKIELSGVIAANVCDMLSLERGILLAGNQPGAGEAELGELHAEFEEKSGSFAASLAALQPLLETPQSRAP